MSVLVSVSLLGVDHKVHVRTHQNVLIYGPLSCMQKIMARPDVQVNTYFPNFSDPPPLHTYFMDGPLVRYCSNEYCCKHLC
jgi:hypothetical protein